MLTVMQLPPVSYYFFYLRFKNPPQPLSSKTLSLCSFLNKRLSFTHIQNNRQNCSSVHFNLYVLIRQAGGHLNDVTRETFLSVTDGDT
jgi:hypothetical protein